MSLTMSPALESVVNSLQFPQFLAQLQTYFDEEQRKREAFYDWITEDTRAEFINGEIIVQPPAKDRHTAASQNLSALLGAYVDKTEMGLVRTETAFVTLTRNDYLPDICYFGQDKAHFIEPDQMRYPAPDLVIEILSPSTEKKDRGLKAEDYALHGVQEYWLIDPTAKTVEQFELQDGVFALKLKINEGQLRSAVVAGFAIPVEAIFDRKRKNEALVALLS